MKIESTIFEGQISQILGSDGTYTLESSQDEFLIDADSLTNFLSELCSYFSHQDEKTGREVYAGGQVRITIEH
jgi:hypothetical protein